jgi:hypothetical protein
LLLALVLDELSLDSQCLFKKVEGMYVVVFDQVRFADAIVGGGGFEGEFAD